ncbi:hypothetical protein OE88DRAFT_1737850 [Heliocybe sulcata]|uniref:DUF6534 domain-containing protein n=1 Tax=Heliocybe sulcata TaxID=5364 RepID=A0A5C3MT91_9AGAM|nr:hypothetical protein OE88DRAFT_1737850 [Heliocybe sulcata]
MDSIKSILVTSYGALLVGLVVSAVLFGVTNLQVFVYFQNYPNDLTLHKLAVGLLWILDALHLALSTHAVFWYLVTNFATIELTIPIVWSFKLEYAINIITILLVQSLYVVRLWKMAPEEGEWLFVLCWLSFFVAAHSTLGMGIATIYYVYRMHDIAQVEKYSWLIYSSYGTGTVVDVAIAATFCWIIWSHRTGHARSDSIIARIMLYVLGSGALTSAFSLICLAVFAAMPTNYVSFGVSFSLNKVYVNSFLAVLISRNSIKQCPDDEAAAQSIHRPTQAQMADFTHCVAPRPPNHGCNSDGMESNLDEVKSVRAETPQGLQKYGQTKSIEIMIERQAFTRVE